MEYNAYDELMSYFYFEFNIYIVLFIIILIGLIKEAAGYIEIKKQNNSIEMSTNDRIYTVLVSLLALIGLISGIFFQGVIMDISPKTTMILLDKSMYLFIASIIMFNLQIVFMVLRDVRIRKNRKYRL